MTVAIRLMLILTLMLTFVSGLEAQETSTPASTTTAEAPATDVAEEVPEGEATAQPSRPPTSYEIRNRFSALLREHPPELVMLLKLDSGLMTNAQFLTGYPEVAKFLEQHPEVTRNGRFYLGDFLHPNQQNRSALDEVFEIIAIAGAWVLSIFSIAWLIRTVIEQKRWNKLSRTQAEVHNKILDRFGSSEEVLQYISTPAGAKFLESAPIPLHTEPAPSPNAPLMRVVRSIQMGVVIAISGLGLLLVSLGFSGRDTAQGLFAIGAIVLCVGAGFIASAVVSLLLSRRLGLWHGPAASEDSRT